MSSTITANLCKEWTNYFCFHTSNKIDQQKSFNSIILPRRFFSMCHFDAIGKNFPLIRPFAPFVEYWVKGAQKMWRSTRNRHRNGVNSLKGSGSSTNEKASDGIQNLKYQLAARRTTTHDAFPPSQATTTRKLTSPFHRPFLSLRRVEQIKGKGVLKLWKKLTARRELIYSIS